MSLEQEIGDSSSSDSDNNVSLAQVSKDLKSKSTKRTTKEDDSETKVLTREKEKEEILGRGKFHTTLAIQNWITVI